MAGQEAENAGFLSLTRGICQIETTGVIFLLFFSSDNVKDEMMEDKNKDDPSHTQNNGQTEGKVIAFYNKIILFIKA